MGISRNSGRIVVIGAGLAGVKAAGTLRKQGFDGSITILGAEAEQPYDRPPLSKGYLLGDTAREKTRLRADQWYADNDIELRLKTPAIAIDLAGRTVATAAGEPLPYDQLLIATGSRPRKLDAPGGDLSGVHYLRTIRNSDALLASLSGGIDGAPVVVIGGGWIGLETAAAARRHGASVTVVEQDRLPLRRVLGAETAAVFADLHGSHGVRFVYGTSVAEFRGEAGTVTDVRLTDGTVLPAAVVIVGVGVRPAVELAGDAGLEIDNGIVTDQHLRTGDEHVYACGDVANSYRPHLDRRLRVDHWANADSGGPAAARAMLGIDDADGYDQVPYFFSDQYDLGMEYTGFVDGPDGYDEVVFRGDVAAREFVAFWLRGGRVLAGMNVNVWDVAGDIESMVRSGRTVEPARLADDSVPLAEV